MMRYRLNEDAISRQDFLDLVDWLSQYPWLTQGERVREFESLWADRVGVRHARFVNSGSSANLLMYSALLASHPRNRKVIVPAVGWSTTLAPALQLGFEPILCDVDPETLGIDVEQLESLCSRHQPAAVMVVHALGVPCRIDAVLALRDRYGFVLLEDACAAAGSEFDGRSVGQFGDLSSFSFFYSHQLTTIEGGMVCTDSDVFASAISQLRSHGWARDVPTAQRDSLESEFGIDSFSAAFTFYLPGYNLRSTDLNARLGLLQLDRFDAAVKQRFDNFRSYQSLLAGSTVRTQSAAEHSMVSNIAFGIVCESSDHRRRVAEALSIAGVETRPLSGGNLARQPSFAGIPGIGSYPVADQVHSAGLQLPNHPGLDATDLSEICECVHMVRS